MPDVTLNIRSWAGWTTARPEPESAAPPLLRRRITPAGRHALALGWNMPDSAKARYIFTSRHGEFTRTLSLMEAAARNEDLSPADFTLSVHHALAGLLSIAQKNTRGHTAIATGADSFCFGLIEAAACLADNPAEPVALIHADDMLPAPYDAFTTPDDMPVAVALALAASPQPDGVTLTQSWSQESSTSIGNHAAAFLDFLSGNAVSHVSPGPERRWEWTRAA